MGILILIKKKKKNTDDHLINSTPSLHKIK